MCFLCHSPIDKIMGSSTINQCKHFVVLDVSNQCQGLESQETLYIMERNLASLQGAFKGFLSSMGRVVSFKVSS
jgi:hypothetical protein